MKKVHIFIISLIALVLAIAALAFFTNSKNQAKSNPTRMAAVETVAQCLQSSGTKFYGASWCPHCARQKGLFLKSVKTLPYVECSQGASPGSPQTDACKEKNITSYPTWIFPNGEVVTGEIVPLDLATKVGCTLDDAAKSELELQKTEYLEEVKTSKS